MARNRGTGTERWVSAILKQYAAQGRAQIEKVDPPTRTIGTRGATRTILLPSPWLDFHGSWTENGGRAICFEVKRTEVPRLPINRNGGITPNQWKAMIRWESAGAVTFLLWEHGGRFGIATVSMIMSALDRGKRTSLPWHETVKVPHTNEFLSIAKLLTN